MDPITAAERPEAIFGSLFWTPVTDVRSTFSAIPHFLSRQRTAGLVGLGMLALLALALPVLALLGGQQPPVAAGNSSALVGAALLGGLPLNGPAQGNAGGSGDFDDGSSGDAGGGGGGADDRIVDCAAVFDAWLDTVLPPEPIQRTILMTVFIGADQSRSVRVVVPEDGSLADVADAMAAHFNASASGLRLVAKVLGARAFLETRISDLDAHAAVHAIPVLEGAARSGKQPAHKQPATKQGSLLGFVNKRPRDPSADPDAHFTWTQVRNAPARRTRAHRARRPWAAKCNDRFLAA